MSPGRFAVLDSGPLIAALDPADPQHLRVVQVLESPGLRFVTPALVIAEVVYFVALRLGSEAEATFLAGLESTDVRLPLAEDWLRCADLVRRYRDFPLGGTDASVVALAERLDTVLIVTLDRRHFDAIRPRHVPAFRLLPE